MSSKYQELYRLPENLYQVDCPVIIEAGALYKNTDDSSVLVQLKLRNINLKRIISCKVAIQAFEINGAPIEGEEIGSYLDILVKTGELFGQKIPIYLSDNNTRLFEISILEVVFDDREVWTSDGSKPIQLPTPNDLSSVIASGDLREQYLIEFGQRCHLAPMLWNGLFFCSCGAINLEGNPCHNCGHTYDSLLSMMDEAFLRQKADERARALEQARERERIAKEQARAAREKALKTTKKIALIVTPIVVVCVVALLVYSHIIIPNQKKNEEYNRAIALYENAEYEKAIEAFTRLESYNDSKEYIDKSKDRMYELASECYKDKKYSEAITLLEKINDYKDSSKLIEKCKEEDVESSSYEKALKLLKEGYLPEGYELLKTLDPNYKLTSELLNECKRWYKYCGLWESNDYTMYERGFRIGSSKKTWRRLIRFFIEVKNDVVETSMIEECNISSKYTFDDTHFTEEIDSINYIIQFDFVSGRLEEHEKGVDPKQSGGIGTFKWKKYDPKFVEDPAKWKHLDYEG